MRRLSGGTGVEEVESCSESTESGIDTSDAEKQEQWSEYRERVRRESRQLKKELVNGMAK